MRTFPLKNGSEKRIVILGGYNRGKSTLVNAMLGRGVLPTRVVPIHPTPVLIRYAPRTVYSFHLEDGAVNGPLDATAYRNFDSKVPGLSGVAYIEIGVPAEILENGLQFVEAHLTSEDRWLHWCISEADGIIFVLDARCSLTAEELVNLERIASFGDRGIFFAVNFWRFLAEMDPEDANLEEAVESRLREHLTRYARMSGTDQYSSRVFRVDALRAFRARTASQTDLSALEESKVPVLVRALIEHCNSTSEA